MEFTWSLPESVKEKATRIAEVKRAIYFVKHSVDSVIKVETAEDVMNVYPMFIQNGCMEAGIVPVFLENDGKEELYLVRV